MKYCNDEEAMSDEGWEDVSGIEVEVAPARDKASVFTMKIDSELLRMLVDQARELGMPTSTLARELIREGLLKSNEFVPTYKLAETLCRRIEKQEEDLSKYRELLKKLDREKGY